MVVTNVKDKSVAKTRALDDGDVSCWNCFTVESDKKENERIPAVTLKTLRKQEREKWKLYSFIANEISKPKAVSLKQKMGTNFAVAQKVDKEITAKLDIQKSLDMQTPELTPSNEIEATPKQYNKKENYVNKYKIEVINTEKAYKFNKITQETQKSDKFISPPANITHKIEIETPTVQKVLSDNKQLSTSHDSTATEITKTDNVAEDMRPRKKRTATTSSDELDKIEKASSSGSDSGYTASSLPHGINSQNSIKSDEPVPATVKTNSLGRNALSLDHEIPRIKSNQVLVFNRYMPSLNTSNDTNGISSSSKSLCVDTSTSLKKTPKTLRWSTLSFHQKPLLQDEVYMSENLSPGHATLPRRSNSPLPHDRDMDRDRFPHNRSLLQTRSESMASVYSGAGEGTRGTVTVKGEVQFSLLYNYRMGALEVGVRRCRDLAAVDTKRNRSDPYVKVYLLPDKSKAGKRKTKVKKNTLSPVFEETLCFVQPLATLSSRTLWLSVWHADMFGRNDFLGEVTLPLADVVFDDPAPTWYKLQERTEQFDENQGTRGDLIIGLKFELHDTSGNISKHKGTLHVLVKEAKNLVATKPNGQADVFCKSYLLPERGRLAKQKTNVSRRTLSPKWEHTFTYKGVTLQELSTRALELSVWDRDRLASNDFMGAVRLSLGSGTYMGSPVNWMDSVGKETTLWQTMMQRPNFWVEGSLPLRPQLSS